MTYFQAYALILKRVVWDCKGLESQSLDYCPKDQEIDCWRTMQKHIWGYTENKARFAAAPWRLFSCLSLPFLYMLPTILVIGMVIQGLGS